MSHLIVQVCWDFFFYIYVRVDFYLAPECAALCMDVLNSSDNLLSIRGIPGFTHSKFL